jgi:hypothetical protein
VESEDIFHNFCELDLCFIKIIIRYQKFRFLSPFGEGRGLPFLASYRCISGHNSGTDMLKQHARRAASCLLNLSHFTRNRWHFSPFTQPLYPSHRRGRGFESRQVHLITPTYWGLRMWIFVDRGIVIDAGGSCLIRLQPYAQSFYDDWSGKLHSSRFRHIINHLSDFVLYIC